MDAAVCRTYTPSCARLFLCVVVKLLGAPFGYSHGLACTMRLGDLSPFIFRFYSNTCHVVRCEGEEGAQGAGVNPHGVQEARRGVREAREGLFRGGTSSQGRPMGVLDVPCTSAEHKNISVGYRKRDSAGSIAVCTR